MKLGIFGGTFNPIHFGHLRAAEEVREKLGLDKIIFVPSGNPPLKNKDLADSRHRYKMVRLATFRNRFFSVSDIEYKKRDKSYSADTLKELRQIYPDAKLYFILGIDAFLDIPGWWKPEELLRLTDFVIVSRPPFKFVHLSASPYLDISRSILRKIDDEKLKSFKTRLNKGKKVILLRLTPLGISATTIRKLVKSGKNIKYILPEEVESYIISNKLYRA